MIMVLPAQVAEKHAVPTIAMFAAFTRIQELYFGGDIGVSVALTVRALTASTAPSPWLPSLADMMLNSGRRSLH